MTILSVIVAVLLVAVVIALVVGISQMARGNSNRSQMMMRWRVGIQFAAVVVILIALVAFRS